jgi:hypothetical protein
MAEFALQVVRLFCRQKYAAASPQFTIEPKITVAAICSKSAANFRLQVVAPMLRTVPHLPSHDAMRIGQF